MRCHAERRSRFRWAKVCRRRPLELARSSARSPPVWKNIEMAKAFAVSDRFAADDALLIPFQFRIFWFVHKSLFVVVDWLTRSTFNPIHDTSRRRRFLQKQERESLG